MDATVTLIKRTIAREKISQAHRSHYYQRLVQIGCGHKATAIAEYVLMLAVAVTSLLMLKMNWVWQIMLLFIWLAIYITLMLQIDGKWNKKLSS